MLANIYAFVTSTSSKNIRNSPRKSLVPFPIHPPSKGGSVGAHHDSVQGNNCLIQKDSPQDQFKEEKRRLNILQAVPVKNVDLDLTSHHWGCYLGIVSLSVF